LPVSFSTSAAPSGDELEAESGASVFLATRFATNSSAVASAKRRSVASCTTSLTKL
jgi:hypothetical protein